jgi:hypothetical protein
VHINDQTVSDKPVIPFGGVGDPGTGSRMGGIQANLDAYNETQWVTAQKRAHDVSHLIVAQLVPESLDVPSGPRHQM